MEIYHVIKVEEAVITELAVFKDFESAMDFYQELVSSVNDPSVDWEAFDEELEIFKGGTDDNCSLQYEDSKGRKCSITILARELDIEEGVDAFVKMMNDHLSLVFTEANGVEHSFTLIAKKREQ